jgi:purine-nucleoside phosphorylase
VLGSGLGAIASSLEDGVSVEATEVPGFPPSRVPGHAGAVHVGRWGSCRTLVFQGRTHLYEGHTDDAVTLPVRTAGALGARFVLLTNAAGAVDSRLAPGSLLCARDLIDLFFRRWSHARAGGTRAVPDPALGRLVGRAASAEGVALASGVLSGSMGPAYETAAEVRWLQRLGVHAVCMSTIPEAIAAGTLGLPVAVVSLITNHATGIAPGPLDHAEVVRWARTAESDLGRVLRASANLLAEEAAS